MERLIKAFSIVSAIAVLGSVVIISSSQENKVKAAGSQIVIASLPEDSSDKGVTYSTRKLMKDYPKGTDNNPTWARRAPRSSIKSARGDDYTEMQILPDTRSLITQCKESIPYQFGDKFEEEGDLSDRFQAGGPGYFLGSNAFGGWATQNFDPVANGWDKTLTKIKDYQAGDYSTHAGNYLSAHWEDFLYNIDQIGSYGTHYNNYPDTGFSSTSCTYSGVTANYLIGGETILFVRKFNLTQEQLDNINQVKFEALTDDFSKVWINGSEIGKATESFYDKTDPSWVMHPSYGFPDKQIDGNGKPDFTINKSILQVGQNSIAIQVTNRMHWEIGRSTDTAAEKAYRINKVEMENPVALYFRLFMDLEESDTIEPDISCSAEPQTGLAPLVVKVSAWDGTPPYSFNMGDGTSPLKDRESPIYYTYGKGGQKKIIVTDSKGKTCEKNVTVKDPTDSSGGEVAP